MHALLRAIALKEGKAKEISARFDIPIPVLKALVEQNKEVLQAIRDSKKGDITPAELDELWISQKYERLRRYQAVADRLYDVAMNEPPDSTALRELRSYMQAVAHELGQLMNRGSGESEGDTLNVSISGVDMDNLR